MTINQFLLMIKARYKLVIAIFLTVVVTAAVVSMAMPKAYTATAAVVLDVKSPDPIAGMVLPGMYQPGYMSTQIDIVRSERVMRGVINKLNLLSNPELRESWAAATNSAAGTMEAWLATLLLARLEAVPAKESNVINISFSGQDPGFSAAMANAVVDSYIATTLELRVEPAKQYRALFEEQAKAGRERLEAAQSRLSKYQRENGLLATDERLDVENARLVELSSQLVAVQSLRADANSRTNAAVGASDRTPEALVSPVLARLNGELALTEAKLKESSAIYGDEHPVIQQLKANLGELRARISSETGKVNASLGVNSRASQEREAVIRAALDQQRAKVLALKGQRDEANVLIKDVESAQLAYDRIMARLDQTNLESQSTQTNVSVVKRATPPYSHSSPNIMLNMALAMAIGLIFAIAVGVGLEMWDRRLRSSEDITLAVGLPMLGVLGDSRRDDDSAGQGLLRLTTASKALPRLGAPSN